MLYAWLKYHTGWSLEDNPFADWMFDGNWSEDKYKMYLGLYNVPGIRNYIDYLKGLRDNDDYMNRHDIDWDDVTQPWNLPGTNNASSGYNFVVNYVSRNVSRLYR